MMPGGAQVPQEAVDRFDEKELVHMEAAIDSMTLAERLDPEGLHGQRRARVARGAGVPVSTVNELIKRFKLMRQQMKKMRSSGILGRLAGRKLDKMKQQQLDELRRRGVNLGDVFPSN